MAYITDLHNHPSFKPYNSQGYRVKPDGKPYTIWDEVPEDPTARKGVAKKLRKILSGIEKDSQSNFDQLVNSGFKSIFCVIHPIERGWFNVSDRLITKIAECMWDFKSEMHIIGYWFTGVPKAKIKKIRRQLAKNDPLDYFMEDTLQEYAFLKKSEKDKGPDKEAFTIAKNYDHYKELVNQDDTIAGILTIEGGHALSYLPRAKDFTKPYDKLSRSKKKEIETRFLENVDRIKGIGEKKTSFQPEHTPFYITLAHFYNNFLAGHSKSYFGTPGKIFEQDVAINHGITPLGRKVIHKLLQRDVEKKERRVLIDVKHMSLKARKEYYDIAKQYKVPVIFSHGAVNGYDQSAFKIKDQEIDHKSGYFSHASINLYNEDIKAIIESDGLIGLSTHEGRMPGGEAKKQFDEINRKMSWDDHNYDQYAREQRDAYIKLFVGNVFQIINVIGKRSAWDHVCTGSDYDGIMDPFNRYPESSDFNRLLGDIQFFLTHPFELRLYKRDRPISLSPRNIKKLMYGISPNEIVRKIAFKNVERFLSKYFTDKFRLGG